LDLHNSNLLILPLVHTKRLKKVQTTHQTLEGKMESSKGLKNELAKLKPAKPIFCSKPRI